MLGYEIRLLVIDELVRGVLVFVNELSMSRTDFDELRRELQDNLTEIRPMNGSADYYEP